MSRLFRHTFFKLPFLGYLLLIKLTIIALIANVMMNPTGQNVACTTSSDTTIIATILLWMLALLASLGALTATVGKLGSPSTYQTMFVRGLYVASVPALLLLPSSPSISNVIEACATSSFFNNLSLYVVSLIGLAILTSIHLLVTAVTHNHKSRALHTAENHGLTHGVFGSQHDATQLLCALKQLRTPLTKFRLEIESMLADDAPKLSEPTELKLQQLSQAVRTMTAGVETQLELAKVETGTHKLAFTDMNLRDVVEEVCDHQRPIILKKNLILLMRTNVTGRNIICADQEKVKQILRTLITQSARMTKRGTITAFLRDDITKNKIWVDILDTGQGMSDRELDAFFTLTTESGTEAALSATTLCLAYKLADAMGGTITAHSAGKGKGSRLTLELPLVL